MWSREGTSGETPAGEVQGPAGTFRGIALSLNQSFMELKLTFDLNPGPLVKLV